MTAEQLQNARASAWRQQGNALLTADDAAAWLREAGLALFLPRTAQIQAPAGSFVEATAGEADPTPKPAVIENATHLLRRLLASGDVIALNLLGIPGDQPDFLATEDTLPFLFGLRGDREWKRGPRGKSSPLVVEVWKLLDKDGALTADEVKERLGRHLTESAALRALTELWTSLRIEPIYSEAEGTRWQLLEGNHEQAMIAGSTMAQGMALSAMVSLYLQSAIAATGDEIEAFLSPVGSRSRIRDAVRGLTATRQLSIRNLGSHEHFFVEGSLPEFAAAVPVDFEASPSALSASIPAVSPVADMLPEVNTPTDVVVHGEEGSFRIEALSDSETENERTMGEGRKRFVAQRNAGSSDRRGFGGRPSTGRSGSSDRPSYGGERKSYSPRPGGAGKPFGERKTFSRGPREGGAPGEKTFHANEPWKEDRRPAAGGDRKPFTPREGGRPAFGGGDRKPFTPREGGRPAFGGGDRKPFTPREGGRPAFGGGDRKPFTPREGGRAAFGGGDRKPFTPREGRSEGGMATPRRTGAPGAAPKRFSPEGGRPARPGAPAGSGKPGGKRPRTSSFTSTGKPRAGGGATGRPGPRTARPGKPASGRKPGAPPRKPGGKGPRRDG